MSNYNATVVVPAFKEGENLAELIELVYAALKKHGMDSTTEMIIVDDNSPDETEQVVTEMQRTYKQVRLIVRKNERGLSSAVMRGFDEAKGDVLLCMDGDLQHPPEKVPELLQALLKGAEFVIGTRYGEGVKISAEWEWHRRVISKGARLLARPLTTLSDPMTGFFGIQKKAYQRARDANTLSPKGFKIAMEIYVKAGVTKVVEIPFDFGIRTKGASKLDSRVITQYLFHLNDLYRFQMPLFLPALALAIFVFLFLFLRLFL